MIHRLSILITLLALLAACGGLPSAQAPTSTASAPDLATSVAAVAPVAPTASTNTTAAATTAATTEATSSGAAPTTVATTSAAFPVVIEHKYGRTEITQPPTRVVSVGFNEQDAILALGVVPVGIRDWYGDQPNATWPWAQDKLGGATPAVLPANELNFEQIAALKPDLITGISSGMTEEDYATLSQIAPTVAQSSEYIDYGVPWQEQTRVIGQALGRSDQAEALVAEVEAQFADTRSQNPAFEGASGVVGVSFDNEYSAFGPQDVRGRVLVSLGFELPQEITNLAGTSFYAPISRERLDLLDTDVLLWVVNTDADRQAIESDPLYQQLAVAREQRAVFLDQRLSGAAAFSSVLSLPYLLESLVPQLAAAVDGAAATATAAADPPIDETATANAATDAPPATDDSMLLTQVPGFPTYTPAPPLFEVVRRDASTMRIKHAYGETDVPASPQRIYVSDLTTYQTLRALGITPIGSAIFTTDLPPSLQSVGADLTLLLDTGEGVNLEKLAALKPDLILGNALAGPGGVSQEQYALFSQIAPTVVFNGSSFFFWQESTRALGEFFGVSDKTAAVVADYEAKLTGYRERTQAKLGDETVTVLLLFDQVMWLYSVGGTFGDDYLPISPTEWAYRDLRLTPAPEVLKLAGNTAWAELSLELIPELKADHLIVFPNAYGGTEVGSGLDDYFNTPLWQTVAAVKNDKVHVLTADSGVPGYWTTPYLIEQFLTELEQ